MNARSKGATAPSRFEFEGTLEREVYLLLQHVSGALGLELAAILKPAGITTEQFHILRILRGAGREGLPLSAVAERSVSGDPDVTRLVDRLEKRAWVTRSRDALDRRMVIARITTDGARLLARLEGRVSTLHERQLGRLTPEELLQLRTLLEKVATSGNP